MDELIFPGHGKDKQKIYIPRKPHPNGFVVYLVCVLTPAGKPVVLDLALDWNPSA